MSKKALFISTVLLWVAIIGGIGAQEHSYPPEQRIGAHVQLPKTGQGFMLMNSKPVSVVNWAGEVGTVTERKEDLCKVEVDAPDVFKDAG